MSIAKKIIESEDKLIVFFVVTAFVWGILMSIFIPVSQIPDEYTHFTNMMNAFGTEVYIDETLGIYYSEANLGTLNEEEVQSVNSTAYFNAGLLPYQHSLKLSDFDISICILKYLPAGLGFYLGVLLHLPRLIAFQLAELFSLIFYIFICIAALKRMPFKREVLLFIMLMPLAIQQAGSISPDVIVNAFSFLITAMILDFKVRESKVGWKDMIIFAIAALMILISKEIYLLLAFGIFIVPLEKFELRLGRGIELAGIIKKYKPVFAILLIAAAAMLGFLARNTRYVKILFACLMQPGRVLLLFRYSLAANKDFYLQTMVGGFGWLDVPESYTFVVVFSIMLFYINLFQSKKSIDAQKNFSIANRIYFVAISAVIFVLIFLSMVSWSFYMYGLDQDADIPELRSYLYQIEILLGVQGRYFIPFLPMLIASLGRGNEIKNEKFYKGIQIAYYILTIFIVVRLIYTRYWLM